MTDTIFRKYDIRGKVGTDLIIENMYDLGMALAYYFLKNKPDTKTVVIGMDGRTHSPEIKKSLCKAMQDSGLDVTFIGVCPSPVLYFSVYTQDLDAGLMITASHNPKEYNGIKICLGEKTVWGEEVQKIKEFYKNKKRVVSKNKGSYSECDVIDSYIDWLKEHFYNLVGMDLSAVIDCGNGVGCAVVHRLIEKMEWPGVTTLFETVDGDYPNHEADPTVEENMRFVKDALFSSEIDVGIGLDGDCDRMAPMTRSGELVTGDKLLAVYATPILKDYPGSVIVGDIKSSSGLTEIVELLGGKLVMSPSGHSIVKKYMHDSNALLGGELSCHFFFADRHFGYDDAFYAMMRLFEIMVESQKSLQELIFEFPNKISTPEIRIACADNKKKELVEKVKSLFAKRPDATIITIDGVRAVMSYGWGLLRVSNTQPVVSLRMESSSEEGLKKVKQDFYNALQPYFEEDFLKEKLFM